MAYVIAEPCIGTKDTACVDACPVDCIHRVDYEQLPELEERLNQQEILPLGVPSPARLKRTLPRAPGGSPSERGDG